MTSTISGTPVTTTWETLQQSRNEAAIQILASGLRSKADDLRHASLKALVARKENAARRAVILNWEHYDQRDIDLLRQHSHGLSPACAALLDDGSYSDKQLALAAINHLDLHENFEEVLELVVKPRSPIRKQAIECLMEVCQRWGQRARHGRPSSMARRTLVDSMYRRLVSYHEHRSAEVVDGWLKLAHWEDSAQRGLIADARLDAYWAIMRRLNHSNDPAALQLLAGYLGRSTTPDGLAQIIGERSEPELLLELAKLADVDTMPAILKHLSRLPPLASINNLYNVMEEVPLELQRRAWVLIAASSDDLSLVLRAVTRLVASGDKENEKVAANMLRHCRNRELQVLVPALQNEQARADGDAALGTLLREIAGWVANSSPVLQFAAHKFLDQFTVANLLNQVRVWPAQMCRAMAEIVKIVESDVADMLKRQLQSPAPKRRQEALQVTKLLEAANQVSDSLMELLDDSRLSVRVDTIDLLGSIQFAPFEAKLPELLDDASTDIQDAARRAIRHQKRLRQENAEQPNASLATEPPGSELLASGVSLS